MKVKMFHRISFIVLIALCLLALGPVKIHAGLDNLKIFTEGYPRVWVFRVAESRACKCAPYPNCFSVWFTAVQRCHGIEGKVLNIEHIAKSDALPYFQLFKQYRPHQVVLAHVCGNSCKNENSQDWAPYAGHWLYWEGCKITQDVPAYKGNTVIHVEDASIFGFDNKLEDICLTELDGSGKPDWDTGEQVHMVSRDLQNSTITVERGMYGTAPRAYSANQAWAAAHVSYFWGVGNWVFNYSTECPLDDWNQPCWKVFSDRLSDKFASCNDLDVFDGVEFDILYHCAELANANGRKADGNGDGIGDDLIFDGVNTYGKGVMLFLKRLREQMGNDKLIMADQMTLKHVRGFGIMNGIEHEGWPVLNDPNLWGWNGAMNRALFWNQNGAIPRISYTAYKYKPSGEWIKLPWNKARLVLAANCFTKSGIAVGGVYTYVNSDPEPEPDESASSFGIFDELRRGTEREKSWLGHLICQQRLALTTTDQLNGQGVEITDDFINRWSGTSMNFSRVTKDGKTALRITKSSDGNMEFVCGSIPTGGGPDVVISFYVKCDTLPDYPSEVGRFLMMSPVTMNLSSKDMTWMNNKDWFHCVFYFSSVIGNPKDFQFRAEGKEDMWIADFTVHHHPDVFYSKYDNGLILANPARQDSFTFKVGSLFSGESYKRITGSSKQDPTFNDGSAVGSTITLGPQDAIFLIKTGGTAYFFIENEVTGKRMRPVTADDDTLLEIATGSGDWLQWEKVPTDSGYFHLKNKQTSKYFRPLNTSDEALLIQKSETSNWTQWKMVDYGNGYFYLENRETGKYFRPQGSANNSLVEQTSTSAGSWKRWKFVNALGKMIADTKEKVMPISFALHQNYPNPFNSMTSIRFSLPHSDIVYLTIYNILGQEVAKISYGKIQAGYHTYIWNGRDMNGNIIPSGVYFYKLKAGNKFRDMKKMLLLK